MPTLTQYTQATQRLLHDPNGSSYPTTDLTAYINETRTQLALDGECVRLLYGVDGLYLSGIFTSGSPTITALASTAAVVVGQQIVSINVATGTTVLSATPTTITMSANASTTTAVAALFQLTPAFNNPTVVGVERYPYPTAVATNVGIKDVIGVKNVSVNWGGNNGSNLYTLEQWSFTKYQAFLGFYGPNINGNPCVWCSYQNHVLMRPIPSQVVPMQWDVVCSVVDLVDDTTPDAIPAVFTDAVKYHAGYLALMNSQNPGNAENLFKLYERYRNRARQFVQRTFTPYLYR